jgi:hypothetical protein
MIVACTAAAAVLGSLVPFAYERPSPSWEASTQMLTHTEIRSSLVRSPLFMVEPITMIMEKYHFRLLLNPTIPLLF